MLRKRSRPFHKDSSFSSDHVVHKARGSPFFTVPGLFVGLSAKISDSDSARSPTSPLDFRLFTNLGSSSFLRSPRSPAGFDCDRVGLGLVDSLNDESRSILFGSQMRIQSPTPNPNSNFRKFEIGSTGTEEQTADSSKPSSFPQARLFTSNSQSFSPKLDPVLSGSLPIDIGNANGLMGSLSASGIELSEDYTCIISHGPNPKTTHIFGDCILDTESIRSFKTGDLILHSDDFLSSCFSCKKRLEQGEDVYIYRGDKAFCSGNCRDQVILCEEESEKPAADNNCADCLGSSFHEEIFMALASE